MTFVLRNYLERIVHSGAHADAKTFEVFHRAALSASEDGELIIELPPHLLAPTSVNATGEQTCQVTIEIHYTLPEPKAGLHFVLAHATAYPNRSPHMYSQSHVEGARTWFPCFEAERSPFTMQFTVKPEFVVVASGQLEKQTLEEATLRRTFHYRIDEATFPARIGVCAGRFEIVVDPNLPYITSFCPPGKSKMLAHTTAFLSQAIQSYEEFFGVKFPYESYKQVFVEDAYTKEDAYAGLSIFCTHLLHDETIIDQTLTSRLILADAAARQWLGNYIPIRNTQDWWLMEGLAGYVALLWYRKSLGNNEYRLLLYRQGLFVCDRGPDVVLAKCGVVGAEENVALWKARLVVYLLEKLLGLDAMRKVVQQLIAPPEAQAGTLPPTLSLHRFLKLIAKLTGHDLKKDGFDKRWIHGSGCVEVECGFWFNRKRHLIEFAVRQGGKAESNKLAVRVHEVDGAHDHLLDLEEDLYGTDLPCYSRLRKNRRKKGQPGEGPEEKEDEKPDVPQPRSDTPILWIRIDPEFEMLRKVQFRQPEKMWINQIELDRDVVAQYEGVQGVGQCNSAAAVAALASLMENPRMFYRIRALAAEALGSIRGEASAAALEALLRYFRSAYFYDGDENSQMRPNDFTDFAAYHVQKAIPVALSQVRDTEGFTPDEVLEFLLHLLKQNDNTGNPYSDYSYLATVIEALGNTQPKSNKGWDSILKQVQRFMHLERLLPSYHNRVTVACLKVMKKMQASGRARLDLDLFTSYTSYGYYRKVRIVALKALGELGLPQGDVVRLVMSIIESDPDPFVRYKAAHLLTSPTRRLHDQACNRIWSYLNGPVSAWDLRVRLALMEAYRVNLGEGLLSLSTSSGSLLAQVEANAPPIDLSAIREPDRRRRSEGKRRKASEVDLEQGTFVASMDSSTPGKIRLVRAKQPGDKLGLSSSTGGTTAPGVAGLSSSSGINSARLDATPLGKKPEDGDSAPVVKRLKLKLGGESIS
ncbi:PBS lyase HEATlike repeat domain containing protein [Acanthamoeba castellanii str. Neff]|uniref:Transcription initiation factor TFIID subunit 2 n=1 Tax=Acanthamoeba castellanii (strain ATCC 30010 / Neff) TaxID=1257118 RepID=L8H1J8_ACACF|nr:PBS lyase HEATlike repeat domain containing protein [Acanthamoeba castellanii str. Neff]ELR19389.1 PBS lyase HEATlike repeat domain containing protein [Acanthamoeba castellanii str. Neff]